MVHTGSVLFSMYGIQLYVYSKKPKITAGNKLDNLFATPEKPLSAFGKIENPVFNGTSDFRHTSTSSPLYTATVKREFMVFDFI